VEKQCQRHLSRPYLKEIVVIEIGESENATPQLHYRLDGEARSKIEDTYLGKTIIVTNREDWEDARIILKGEMGNRVRLITTSFSTRSHRSEMNPLRDRPLSRKTLWISEKSGFLPFHFPF
jgi:hypothetical protein